MDSNLPVRAHLALAVIVFAVAAGSWLRLHDLGGADFSMDELDHYYAAQSIQEGEAPRLPSGNRYERGTGYSQVVALTTRWMEDSEFAARLPSAAAGILCVLVFAGIGWQVGGPGTAALAAILMAVYPEAIRESRRARFYMFQLLLGLGALYTGWRTVAGAWPASGNSSTTGNTSIASVGRVWAWAVATLALFALASILQVTTLSVVVGWLLGLAVPAAVTVQRTGSVNLGRNPALQVLGAVGCGALVFLVARPGVVAEMVELARYVPLWRGGEPGDPRFYFWRLVADYPIVVSLSPVIFLVLWFRRPALGTHLLTWFSIPFLLHSFVFAWKGERYILLAVPGLLLAAAYAGALGADRLRVWLRERLRVEYGLTGKLAAPAGVAGAALAVAVALLTTPAVTPSKIPTAKKGIDWTCTSKVIEEIDPAGGRPVGSSVPLPALHYWGRLDFVVAIDYLELPDAPTPPGGWWSRVGEPDWYSGRPVLPTPPAIRGHFPAADSLIVAVDHDRRRYGNIAPELLTRLRDEGRELTGGQCGRISIYLWVPRAR